MSAPQSPKQLANQLHSRLERAIEANDEKAAEEVTNDILALTIGTIAAQQSKGPLPPKSPAEIDAYLTKLATPEPESPRPIPPSKLRA